MKALIRADSSPDFPPDFAARPQRIPTIL